MPNQQVNKKSDIVEAKIVSINKDQQSYDMMIDIFAGLTIQLANDER